MKREDKETLYEDFVEIVKEEGKVFASPSHSQTFPDKIEFSAILEWQWDGELFANTITRRVVANKEMPAFHIYNR